MPVIVKAALADQIVDIVRARIIAGEMAGDAPVRQDALAAELGVSKIPLREALARLEQDGLLVSERNRGYVVRALSVEEAYDVFDLRLKIEPEAVAAAAAMLTPADVALGRRALTALDAAVAAGSPNAGALNRAFHVALIRPGGRPVTLQTVERLQAIAERYVVRHLAPSGRSERASDEHQALFEAWSTGQAAEAAELSARHIATTLADLKIELGKHPEQSGQSRRAGPR